MTVLGLSQAETVALRPRHGWGDCWSQRGFHRGTRQKRVRSQQFWLCPHWALEARLNTGSRMNGDIHVRLCVQQRWTRSAGTIPAEARIRSLVAWIARWRETKTLEPIDDTIGRMVANHQAVARANAYVASTVNGSGGRARNREGEGSMFHRNLIDAMNHSGGVEATAW
jgi:hypothetical protein